MLALVLDDTVCAHCEAGGAVVEQLGRSWMC